MTVFELFPIGALVTTSPLPGDESPWNGLTGHIEAVEPQADGSAWIYVQLWINKPGVVLPDGYAIPATTSIVKWFANDEIIVDHAVDVNAVCREICDLFLLEHYLKDES